MEHTFTQEQIAAIADALGHTDEGLTGTEIGALCSRCRIIDPGTMTKKERVRIAFATTQAERGNRRALIEFIRAALNPARHTRAPNRFEPMRANVNRALAFAGLIVTEAGEIEKVERATTLTEAERRARDLRADLEPRGVHADVLRFCRAELVEQNYFHAVQEAMKSVADKIRTRTGLTDDGSTLVDRALCGGVPMLAINPHQTESERSEQKGFANLVRGTFGMFRNTTAHEARINWPMAKADAEDLLTIVSLIHRRIDASWMPPRV